MKYSNYIGVVAAIALVAFCFAPWVYISSLQSTLTGFYTAGTVFGQPGIMHTVLCSLAIICFLVQAVWAKRVNIFFCAFNLAWSFKNLIVMGQCEMGECPELLWGIYAVVAAAVVMMVMSLLPKMKVN